MAKKRAKKRKPNNENSLVQRGPLRVREPIVLLFSATSFLLSALLSLVTIFIADDCIHSLRISGKLMAILLLGGALAAGVYLMTRFIRHEASCDAECTSLTYTPTLRQTFNIQVSEIKRVDISPDASCMTANDCHGREIFTIPLNMKGALELKRRLKKKSHMIQVAYDKDRDPLAMLRTAYSYFGGIALALCMMSFFLSRRFDNILFFVIPLIWAFFNAFVAKTYTDSEDIPEFLICSSILLISLVNGHQGIVLDRFALVFFLTALGGMLWVQYYAQTDSNDIISALKILGIAIALSLCVTVGINYTMSTTDTIEALITDKYIIEQRRGHDDYIIEVINKDARLQYEPVEVFEDTYENLKVGESYEVVVRNSIFNVRTVSDPQYEELFKTKAIFNQKGWKKYVMLFAIMLSGALVIVLYRRGGEMLLLFAVSAILASALAISTFASGEPIWLGLLFVLFAVVALLFLLLFR